MRQRLFFILFLLVGFGLRTIQLTQLPPGLTHDEANHGREAIGVLDGIFLFYFPLNYGSEPLYSYTVAGMMKAIGEHPFALRLVNVYAGIFALAILYRWATSIFGLGVGILGMGLMAVSFWPLAGSREALRAGLMPFFFTLAVTCYWQTLRRAEGNSTALATLKFSVALAVTFHIYLSARVAWLLFPLFLLYLLLTNRDQFRLAAFPTVGGLALTGLFILPMFLYLQAHPEALTRLDMLDAPLQAIRSLDFPIIWKNFSGGLFGLIVPGYGDQFLAYNIPGKPTLDAITALFFIAGISISLWRWRQPKYAFILLWFFAGISPSLITGATANTTRNVAAMPVLYLLAGVGFLSIVPKLTNISPQFGKKSSLLAAGFWLSIVAIGSGRDYFGRWGKSPQVRAAYRHTLTASLAYIDRSEMPSETVYIFSTLYPGAAHDSSVGLVASELPAKQTRWVDGRLGLIVPQADSANFVIPASTPLHPTLASMLTVQTRENLLPTDLNPFFELAALINSAQLDQLLMGSVPLRANFNNGVGLSHIQWLRPHTVPGETAELLTVWHVTNPDRIVPAIPPALPTDASIFSHVLDAEGQIISQWDGLSAPSWSWQKGDTVLQIHQFEMPADAAPGEYTVIVGLYDRVSGARSPIFGDFDQFVGDYVELPPLIIAGSPS